MIVDQAEKTLERRAVEQVLAGMNLVGHVDARRIERIQDRTPAARQFLECSLDQAGGSLRPRIQIRPCQRAGERRVRLEPQILRSARAFENLLDCPFLPRLRIAAHLLGREAVEGFVVRGMHGDELALQVRRQLGDLQAVLREHALHLIAVSLALRRAIEIEQPRLPGRNLHGLEAETRRPLAYRAQRVEWRRVAGELRQKDGRAFDRSHGRVTSRCCAGSRN
jgi:hypothetical protein